MIPEITRKLPPLWYSWGLWAYSLRFDPRCIKKYTKPQPNDTVLDVGAFHGEFTIPSSIPAHKVYAIEPDMRSFHYLIQATSDIDNITVLNCGIWDKFGVKEFKNANDPSDSVLAPFATDSDGYDTTHVPVFRLDDLKFMPEITFLKIDGEGAEPEILKSLGEHRPKKISVDVSPERNGISTKPKCKYLLKEMGYELFDEGQILVAIHL